MSKIVYLSDKRDTYSHKKVQMDASSLLQEFQDHYSEREFQKQYMKLLSNQKEK